jgi:hypothetical protein
VQYYCGCFNARAAAGPRAWPSVQPRDLVCGRCIAALNSKAVPGALRGGEHVSLQSPPNPTHPSDFQPVAMPRP